MTLDDKATESEEKFRDFALKVRMPELKPIGQCYWCGEVTHGVFCSTECREDYEQKQRFKR